MARFKDFQCDCCLETAGPLEISEQVPQGWVRVQQKGWNAYRGAPSWNAVLSEC